MVKYKRGELLSGQIQMWTVAQWSNTNVDSCSVVKYKRGQLLSGQIHMWTVAPGQTVGVLRDESMGTN